MGKKLNKNFTYLIKKNEKIRVSVRTEETSLEKRAKVRLK